MAITAEHVEQPGTEHSLGEHSERVAPLRERRGLAGLLSVGRRGHLVVGVALLGYLVIHAAVLLAAVVVALTIWDAFPAPAGTVVFMTVGLLGVAAAPTVARGIYHRLRETVVEMET